ncbi:MAG: polysaccharide deacetylase family protein [Bacillota bacterium]
MEFLFVRKKVLVFVMMIFFVVGSFVSGYFLGSKSRQSLPATAVTGQKLVPIYWVDRSDQKISLTFDGTWGADYTEQLLDILAKHEIKVTFFFAGYWLEEYPELAKKIAQNGHEIGNHTYTHPHCSNLSQKDLIKELQDTQKLIRELTGQKPRFFRPPFGDYNNSVIRTAHQLDYQVVQWSLDSLDWKEPGADFIVQRILDNTESGEIILMHNNAPHTPEALETIIPQLINKGFEIVPLGELVYQNDYQIQPHNGLQIRSQGAVFRE